LDFVSSARHIKAGSGGDGSGDRSTGADGEDKFIEVPLGTVVRDKETGEVLFEITEDGENKFCLEVVRRFRKLAL
jgi:GTP-binding protein